MELCNQIAYKQFILIYLFGDFAGIFIVVVDYGGKFYIKNRDVSRVLKYKGKKEMIHVYGNA